MDNNMNNRVYTKFQKHVNNASEVVSADHINKLQQSVNETELEITKLNDTEFIDKLMDTFENNLYANSMFANEINDQKYIDMSLSSNIKYIKEDMGFAVDNASINGEMTTTLIFSSLGNGVRLNDFFLIVDQYIPVGSAINYYLMTDKGEKYPIKPNEPKLPLHIHANITGFKIKAEMRKNALGESPKIFALAALFFDSGVEAQYGLTNPDLKRFHKFGIGITVLYRDRAQEDRLVKIEEQTKVTELIYDSEGLLSKVVTTFNEDKVIETDTLNYGDYLNSENIIEKVLLSISTDVSNENGDPFDYSMFGFED